MKKNVGSKELPSRNIRACVRASENGPETGKSW